MCNYSKKIYIWMTLPMWIYLFNYLHLYTVQSEGNGWLQWLWHDGMSQSTEEGKCTARWGTNSLGACITTDYQYGDSKEGILQVNTIKQISTFLMLLFSVSELHSCCAGDMEPRKPWGTQTSTAIQICLLMFVIAIILRWHFEPPTPNGAMWFWCIES